jgi:Ca-activated chloride channel family protein
MSFQWPFLLWALLLVVPALGGYALFERHRAASARRFTTAAMLPNVAPTAPRWRRHVPTALYLLGFICLLVALARPQTALSVPRERAAVVLLMDSSMSMQATDVDPTRLEAAQRAAFAFLERVPRRYQVGVVSFAGKARILNRPTTDRVAVRRALRSLLPRWGTAIGDGLVRALQTRPEARRGEGRAQATPMVVLLLSDGVNTVGSDPLQAAERARRAGVRVYAIALGTDRPSRAAGRSRVVQPSNDALLRRIAEVTRGRFFAAPSVDRLTAAYRNLGSSVGLVTEQHEVTVAFVAAALVLLAAGGVVSFAWFNRFP